MFQVNSTDFGIPQHRPRVYFVGLLRSQVCPHFAQTSPEVLEAFMKAKLQKVHLKPGNFRNFLEERGAPIEVNSLTATQSTRSVRHDAGCTCGVRSLCALHTCGCPMCKREGHEKMKCIWRRGQTKSMQSLPFLGFPSEMAKGLPGRAGGIGKLACQSAFEFMSECFGYFAR